MAVRLTGEYFDINGTEYLVDIHDTDFVGSSTGFDVNFCQIRYDSDDQNDPNAAIVGSRAEVGITVPYEDATLLTFIEDFAGGEEGRFLVEITDVFNNRIVWRGILTPDFSGEEDTAPQFIFKVSAVCGLATLKKIPYNDGTDLYEGVERFTTHLATALSKCSHTDTFWGASDIFMRTFVDWWEVAMVGGPTGNALHQSGVDHVTFYDVQELGDLDKECLSSYDVVKEILKTFNARIFQSEGVWWIEQIPYRTAATVNSRNHSKSGGYLSNTNYTGFNEIDQTRSGAKIATANYDFLPALAKTTITWVSKRRRNFMRYWSDSFPSFNQEVPAHSGVAVLRLKFVINYLIRDDLTGNPGITGDYMFPKFTLKIGGNYLRRGYSVQNFSAYVDDLEWTGTPDGFYVPINVGVIPTNGDPVKGSITVEIITPPLPASGSANSFSYNINAADVVDWFGVLSDPTWWFIDYRVVDPYLEVFIDGTPFVTEDKLVYKTTNPGNASEKYEQDTIIGYLDSTVAAGSIRVLDGVNWVLGGLWGQGVETRDDPISAILSRNIQNARLSPLRRLNGTLFGDFRIHQLLETIDNKQWMMTSATWDLGRNTLNGTWFQLDYGTAGVSVTPIKIKILPLGKIPAVDPNLPSGTTTQNQGFAANPPPTVLKPIAFNATDAVIDLGDVLTSIPIEDAATGTEFLSGDGVTLVNPITGQYQTFEISTPPGPGDTSLSVVSEAAAYNFPLGSYLVVKQNAYSFRLPQGTAEGQIMRWDDVNEVWEVYSGTTDGHVLTWDTTNGWQAEASAGGGLSDGDKGDITVSGGGTVWNIDAAVVGTTELVDLNVTTGKLADNAVTTVKITDANVTTAKIADDAVTFAKLQNIGEGKLIGRDSPGGGAGAAYEISLGASLAFDTGGILQRAGLTGDVTAVVDSNTLTISDNAVNNFKLANMAAKTIKGNDTAGVADPADLTVAQAQTLLGFLNAAANLVAPRIPFANDANTLQDEVNLRWLTATQEVIIGGDVSLDARFSHNSTGNITGSSTLLAGDNNVSGDYMILLKNTRNVSGTGRSFYIAEVGGTSAGDAFYVARIAGGQDWAFGIDNSDSDKFKITSSTAPGNVANSGLIITNAGAALFGFNIDAPARTVDIAGGNRAVNHINTSAPPVASLLGTGLGTGGTVDSITGGNNGFTVTFTTGTTPAADGDLFRLTFANAFTTTSHFVLRGRNVNALNNESKVYVNGTSPAFLSMKANGTMPESQQFIFVFVGCGQ